MYSHELDTSDYRKRFPDAPMKSEDRIKSHSETAENMHEEGKIEYKKGENNGNWKGGKIKKDCDYCGESIRRRPSMFRGDKTFCDNECEADYKSEEWVGTDKVGNRSGPLSEDIKRKISESHKGKEGLYGEDNPNWSGGVSFEPYPTEFNVKLKKKIRDRDDRECKLCGVDEEKIDRKLSVHHIDYDKQNTNESNLISLCPRCHGKTNGNRSKWEEKLNNKKVVK